MCQVDILLATYNGERYLSQQLDSIFSQEYQEFNILIRDDGSTDSTVSIIAAYQKKYPEKIHYIEDDVGNMGSSKCFMLLLQFANSDYIMFCDQDDIWLPKKISVSLNKIRSLENSSSLSAGTVPLLVFTDLVVVDKNLNVINESFWKYQKLIPETAKKWKSLLAQNVITGCTVIINRRAVDVCLPYSINMMHDQWLGVNVSKHGLVDFTDEKTILYRQHSDNVDGAHKYGLEYVLFKLRNLISVLYRLQSFSKYFGDVSFFQLLYLKVIINLNRVINTNNHE